MYTSERDYNPLINKIIEEKSRNADRNPISFTLIDIDHFHRNKINSNNLLEEVYEALKSDLPGLLYLGRDEFAFVATNKRMEDLLLILTLSKKNLNEQLNIQFSAGIAEYPKHGEDLVELIRNLEESVYNAKKDGRNTILFASETKMKMKANYFTLIQLKRLNELSKDLKRTEASLLRESLDLLFRKYED